MATGMRTDALFPHFFTITRMADTPGFLHLIYLRDERVATLSIRLFRGPKDASRGTRVRLRARCAPYVIAASGNISVACCGIAP